MNSIRRPAVAGLFYPNDSRELHAMVQGFLKKAATTGNSPKAIIAPHAGYAYSGPVAASAYALLASGKDTIRKVVLMGPSHRVGFRGIAVASADFYATPLGTVPIDRKTLEKILDLPFVGLLDQAHAREHSLEVHLPFLQEILGTFELIPLVAGEATPEEVGQVLERLWGGAETLIVISSDLSHYHDYLTAGSMDRATSKAIENLRPEDINCESACGRVPVNGLLYLARQRGMSARTVDLRNSGDTAGGKDKVVGYGAYVFE
jgi:AmmeMemoRadiSam system protein B